MTRMQIGIVSASIAVIGTCAAGGYAYDRHRQQEERALLAQAQARQAAAAQKAQEPKPLSAEEQDRLVDRVTAELDKCGCDRPQLEKVEKALDEVLRVNPDHVKARLQMARYYLTAGYQYGNTYTRESRFHANIQVEVALSASGYKSADAWVMSGFMKFINGAYPAATLALDKAEALGTDNPWLYLNRVDVLRAQRVSDRGEPQLQKLEASYAGRGVEIPTRIRLEIHKRRADLYADQRRIKEANEEWQKNLALDGSAFQHGNYAIFLLETAGDPDAAIEQARQALALMNYGSARQILAESHIVKWAQLKAKNAPEADAHLAAAYEYSKDLSWAMPSIAMAADAGPAMQTAVRQLQKLGISIDVLDEDGDTGLMGAVITGRTKSIDFLIGHGASKNTARKSGASLISQAAHSGRPEVLAALLRHGFKVNSLDPSGNAPLHWAVGMHRQRTVRQLIELKADINIRNKPDGITPLMQAVQVIDADIARMLVEAGADPTLRSIKTGQTAAEMADVRLAQKIDPEPPTELVAYLHEVAARPVKSARRK